MMKQAKRTTAQRLRDGKAIDAAVRRAVRAAVKRRSSGASSSRRGNRAA